jgi:hypothetical protein
MVKVVDEARGVKVGSEVGKWKVIGKPFKADYWRVVVECKCGRVVATRLGHLTGGNSNSCRICSLQSHGESKTSLYAVWCSMRNRCSLPSDTNYHKYGERGIRVCNEWVESWFAFRDWAHANGYAEGLEIDRIEVNGNYEPVNCRWATRSVNQRNKRNNRVVEAFGESKTMADWCEDERCSVGYHTLYCRINRGWSAEKAITSPRTDNHDR